MRQHWTLDPDVVFMNHGAFGATPIPVIAAQSRIKAELEREPVYFFERRFEPLLDAAREKVATFLGARTEDVAFIKNTTSGVSAVLRSLDFAPGDRILTTDHAYNACKNAVDFIASRTGAEVVRVSIPLPLTDPDAVVQTLLAAVTPKVRLALIDHVTSPTGMILPIDRIVRALRERGIETLVDGAHGPGMTETNLTALDAAYYVGNFHKWVCAPKGSAFICARRDRQEGLHPVTISHGLTSTRPRGRYLDEFDWTGSDDPSAWLATPDAIDFIASLFPGGWPEARRRNRELALTARNLVAGALGVTTQLVPDSMTGSLAIVPLPDTTLDTTLNPNDEPLHRALKDRHGIEVPVVIWPRPPTRHIRVAAHVYNSISDYEKLIPALKTELGI